MRSFFEFMEKIRREKSINEEGEQQALPQAPPQPPAQPPANQTAPDAAPDQESGTSKPAHDAEFEKLAQIMKSSMKELSDENRKKVEDFLTSNELMDTDTSSDKEEDQQAGSQAPPDQAQAQAQAGQMAAATPPAAPPAPGATPPQQ